MTSLLAAIDAQRAALAPATDEQITDACMSLLVHADVIGMNKIPEVAALKAVWSAHCGDMPGCLLAKGLAEVLKHWTNTFCLPAPGAVWEQIGTELARMRADLSTLEKAQAETAEQLDPLDREPSSDMEELLANTRRILRAAGGKRWAA